LLEIDAEILQTTQAQINGILNGTGSLWALSYFLEVKGRFNENETIFESLKSSVLKMNEIVNNPNNSNNVSKPTKK